MCIRDRYRIPKGFTLTDYQNDCLEKMEKRFSKDNNIAAFIMESGAQMAGGVIIYPKDFQRKISKLCKKHDILFVLDEIATGFGRLGSMVQYKEQKSIPDIVAYGKMLTGGYLTMAATLSSKKIQHSSMFNLTNEPVEKLAKNLIKISPGMNKVFYSDNGSSAMEIAIKIALQYWKNIGAVSYTHLTLPTIYSV